jgi:hypothetical protein
MDQPNDLQEVKSLREVPRQPEHCGVRMRKLTSASATTGAMIIIHACEKCGTQIREKK